MDPLITIIITAISTVLAKALWDWVINKNGKKEFKEFKDNNDAELKELKTLHETKLKDLKINYDNKLKDLEGDFEKRLDEKFSSVKEIKTNIEDQRKEFAELRDLIILSYVKKTDYEKLASRVEEVRDTTMMNSNNVQMVKETARQNVQRISTLESR
jgi:hypothetical protein|tara:strand:+ start:35726 stop:36196 length:471 start_codon:yes stop_codon:yes gene_type:complete